MSTTMQPAVQQRPQAPAGATPTPEAPRRRKAWAVHVQRIDGPDGIYFAPTRAKARSKVIADIRDAWDCDWLRAAKHILAIRRAPHVDVLLPQPHPLADTLSIEHLHIVTHAYGGTGPQAGYRNHYFTTSDDPDLLALTETGFFRRGREVPARFSGGDPHTYFQLTELGRAVAASLVDTY
ncbi:hypothetical protein EOD42_09050 [Rhodovarius crocodyli]|uniref:Uncharacterized protein n=1 Tax=Rhodovarius crocodyli TaxID=1979269 RepID=A0A437MK11_9PROT|nr:hypothetical protein [Rhodovarius crocodyli]RVT97925.1 hypothetical protein EOD42_09050 [Rhodovarius crocodyli]